MKRLYRLRFFYGLLGFLLMAWVMPPGFAWGSATLYQGGNALGSVPTTIGSDSTSWVSLTDTGALLGFQASVSGEELHLVRGDAHFRVVLNAVAAWKDIYLIPLYGAAFERDGRWWLDIPSVLSLFQRVSGSGAANRLRFEVDLNAPLPAAVPPESPPVPPSPKDTEGGSDRADVPEKEPGKGEARPPLLPQEGKAESPGDASRKGGDSGDSLEYNP